MSDNGRTQLYLVGSCDGVDGLCDVIAERDDLELVGVSADPHEARRALSQWHIDAVLIAVEQARLPRDQVALVREVTASPIILLVPPHNAGVLNEALTADVADALLLPQPSPALVFAIRKAVGVRMADDAAGDVGLTVGVFSPKGGTGKTLTSTNLAAALTVCHERRTLLVDLDLQFGDCAIALGLEPESTIYDLVTAPGELDADKLSGYTTRHTSGVHLLAAPANPEEAELVPVPRLARLLEVAAGAYDVVVVDMPPFLHAPVLAALDRIDELLVLATLDVPTLKNVHQSLETLEQLGIANDRVALVLNRATAPAGIKPHDVEVALDARIRFSLPEDPAAQLAVNRGAPVVLAEPRAAFTKAIRELARTVDGARAHARRRVETQ